MTSNAANSVVWFRRDLRLADNEALVAASLTGSVTPPFVIDPMFFERSGAARLVFLLRSLHELNQAMGGALVIRTGNPVDVVAAVALEVGAERVFAAKDFAPYGQSRDKQVAARLHTVGAELCSIGSAYAVNPGVVRKADNTPYSVFTPFFKTWLTQDLVAPLLNWRRSYDIRPPSLDDVSAFRTDPRYASLSDSELLRSESLSDVQARLLPYWYEHIVPQLEDGMTVLLGAHGNSLRALVKHIEDISDAAVVELEIATGTPRVYEVNCTNTGLTFSSAQILSDEK